MNTELPPVIDNRPVTERIKTFEDAVAALGDDHPFVRSYSGYANNIHEDSKNDADIVAYLKLRVITEALNEGWHPAFTAGERRWYAWFELVNKNALEIMSDEEKEERLSVTRAFGDAFTNSDIVYSTSGNISADWFTSINSSRLALKNDKLAKYAAKQFAELYADFALK